MCLAPADITILFESLLEHCPKGCGIPVAVYGIGVYDREHAKEFLTLFWDLTRKLRKERAGATGQAAKEAAVQEMNKKADPVLKVLFM